MELKKGYKQTEVGVIPDEWKLMSINQIFEFHSTSNYSKAEMLSDGEIGCFHYGLIHSLPNNNYDIRTGVKYFVTKQQAKYEFIKEGDVVMVDASEDLSGVNKSIEISDVQDKLFIAGLHTYLLRDKGFYQKNFKGPILNSYHSKAQFYRLAVGMKVYGVSKQQLKTVLLPIPSKSEQIAIAQTLSDTDAYITSLEKLIEKKRKIKQGAMQDLLKPKDGWEEKRFNEICDLIHGHQFLSTDFVEESDGIKVVKIGNVQSGKFNTNDCDRVTKEKLHLYKKYIIKNGDILMSLTGNIGRVVIVENIKETLLQNYRVGKFEAKDIDNRFLAYCLASPSTTKQLELNSNQTSQANFGKQDFIKIKISIPKDRSTQEFIANTLYDLDSEVSLLEKKLSKAKMLKLGMMQNLLTGKIRLI